MFNQDDYTTNYIKQALWGDEPPQAPDKAKCNGSLEVLETLHIIRKASPPEVARKVFESAIVRHRPEYAKHLSPEQTDEPLSFGEMESKPDDDQLALRISEEWGERLRHFHGDWHEYRDGYWQRRQQPEIQSEIRVALRRWRNNGVRVTQSRIRAIADMLQDDCFVPDRDVIDTASERRKYIPLANGLFNIEAMQLEPHRQDLYFTNQLGFEFDARATCPVFLRFLETSLVLPDMQTVVTDTEMILFVQEALAYSMTARTDLKASFWLYGKPDSGKSTLLSLIRSIMGGLHGTIDLNGLGASKFMLGEIVGKRVVTFSEADKDVMLPDGLYKALTGGTDEMWADVKNKPGVTFVPEAKLWWAMNNAPRTTDRSGATLNRLYPVLFNRSIPKHERIQNLDQKLAAERAGIFNWLLQGYERLLNQKRFTEATNATRWKDDYRRKNDTELSFYDACLVKNPNMSIQSSELYDKYRNWCERNGFRAKNINQASEEWERLGMEKHVRDGRRFWRGVDFSKTES